MRYQAEIQVASDRYVCLQLPTFFPEGRATVIVTVALGESSADRGISGDEPDRQDIEWWDEFDEED